MFPETLWGLAALGVIVGGFAVLAWRRFPMAYAMAVLCIGVYLLELVAPRCALAGGGMPQTFVGNCVLVELSFIAPLTAAGERLLTPLTYMFVHADLLHIAGNMFILLTAGPVLEERIGTRNFLLLYFAAGFAAVAATVGLWQIDYFPGAGAYAPNLGASGAIFGVLTGFAVLWPKERLPMITPFIGFIFWMPAITVLLLYLGFNLVYLVTNSGVAWWGHFAGFLVGFALAPYLHQHLPAHASAKPLVVDVEALRPLARTRIQESALRELERLQHGGTHDDALLAEAWWDKFVQRAQCPQCEAKLDQAGGRLVCPQGHVDVAAVKL